MLLESNFKSNSSRIRRKAYNVDNPVQAKRSSGYGYNCHPINPVAGWTPAEFRERERISYPELRFACTGLSMRKTYGLVLKNKK